MFPYLYKANLRKVTESLDARESDHFYFTEKNA